MKERIVSLMHPMAERVVPRWFGAGLAVWVLVGLPCQAAEQMPPARVGVAAVQQRELVGGQTFVGTVMPLRTSAVGSAVEGRVEELLVREGDEVKQDAPLARLRTEQLKFQRESAQAELKSRQQELAELENGSLPEQIQQARAEMQAAKALMDFAAARLKRTQALFARKAATTDELQDHTSAAEAAQQTYLAKKAAWELAVAGPRKEKIEQSRARVRAQEEEVGRLDDEIDLHTIRAPFSGYVTREHTEAGQWIAKGNPVVELVDVHQVDVEVPVLEKYIPQVQLGAEVWVEIGALSGQMWAGRVAVIVPQADVRSRSFPVKVRLENQRQGASVALKPGMFARVTLPVGSKTKGLLAPKDALVLGGQSPVVYVVDPMPASSPSATSPPGGAGPSSGPSASPAPDGMARQVPVELGAAMGDWIEVRGPLRAGDLVVTEGNERLFPGQPLILVHRDQRQPAAGSGIADVPPRGGGGVRMPHPPTAGRPATKSSQ
jgi:HlyD family secretion protein